MRLQSPFGVVTPTLDGDVLSALAGADDWFTVRRIQHIVRDRSAEGIRKTLHRLVREGIVDEQQAGRASLYRLNRDHLAAGPIIAIANLRGTFVDRLRSEMQSWPSPPTFAALFGSAATGTMTERSDIDLFILLPNNAEEVDEEQWPALLDDLVKRASRWTGSDVRPLTFTIGEAEGAAVEEPVLQFIADDGMPIVGDKSLFRRIVGAR